MDSIFGCFVGYGVSPSAYFMIQYAVGFSEGGRHGGDLFFHYCIL